MGRFGRDDFWLQMHFHVDSFLWIQNGLIINLCSQEAANLRYTMIYHERKNKYALVAHRRSIRIIAEKLELSTKQLVGTWVSIHRTCYHVGSIRPSTCVPSPEALHTENPLAVSISAQWLRKLWCENHIYSMENHEMRSKFCCTRGIWSQTCLHCAGKHIWTYIQKKRAYWITGSDTCRVQEIYTCVRQQNKTSPCLEQEVTLLL